ncbi:MAG: molybdenum ABC transporter ATP-binding protein [Beijerinckiaceae bacterium]
MSLFVSIDHRLGDFRLCVDFACEGRLTALFGASGSGKTSIVNAIAGLLRPDRARIVIDGETLTDTAAGVFLAPHRRHVGYVFQEARLFPHMNVRQNLLYAQWFGGRRGGAGTGFDGVVDMLGIGSLLRRYPSHLSGGEKQRVAIGRALLSHPRVLLMDEPLASLDAARKQEILPYIERLRDEANVPIVYVSHAVDEVRRLADFVVVMGDGRVKAAGTPHQTLVDDSLRRSGAGNVLEVRAMHVKPDGLVAYTTPAGVLCGARGDGHARQISISPEHILLTLREPGRTSARNVLAGVVASIRPEGPGSVTVLVRVGDTQLVATASSAFVHDAALHEGAPVRLLVADFSVL